MSSIFTNPFQSQIPSSTKDPSFKKKLYQMVVNQMSFDGFVGTANGIANATLTPPSESLSGNPDRLAELVLLGMQYELEKSRDLVILEKGQEPKKKEKAYKATKCDFTTRFITTHKEACRCAKFSPDGRYVVTGSADCSLKLLDVDKMHFHNQTKAEVEEYTAARPVIRTFYDHTQPINDIDFHSTSPIIISASKDSTIKLFDYTKASMKRSYKYIQESHNVRSINIHPSGDYMLAGTDHNVIRLYDLNTFQCYTSVNPQDQHFNAINQVRYSVDGKLFVSASDDGAIKIWDGVTGRCVNTIPNAHSGAAYSVQFSRNTRYLLSGGQDAVAKLWDLSTGRQVKSYSKQAASSASVPVPNIPGQHVQTTFNYDEEFVISSDGADVWIWSTRTGEVLHRLTGHNKQIRWVASSPTEQAFMSCSEDNRARFWADESSCML